VVVTFDHDFRRAVVRRGCGASIFEVVRLRRGNGSRMYTRMSSPASPPANETFVYWPIGILGNPTLVSAR
jgi:hypothetical protein